VPLHETAGINSSSEDRSTFGALGFLRPLTGHGAWDSIFRDPGTFPTTDLTSSPRIESNKVLRRAENRLSNPAAWKRTVSLSVLLAQMQGVTFDEAALLFGTSSKQLRRMVRFEITVPVRKYETRILMVAEIVRHLHRVLEPSATGRWLNTPIPALAQRTPAEAIRRSRIADVLNVTRSYVEPLAYT